MKIAVLGAGNGGQAMAAYLALKGCLVNLYNRSPIKIEAVKKLGGIFLSGVCQGFGRLNVISSDISQVIEDVDLLMIVTPAGAHRFFAEQLSPYLKDGQKIVLNPGRTGGALEFYNLLQDYHCTADVIISEAQTFIFASRIIGPAQARIYGIKKHVSVAAFPSSRTRELIDDLSEILPQFSPVENVLKTSLDNIGAIFHPAPTLLNMAWIESTSGDFPYYKKGISPSVCKIIEKMDMERMKVAYAFDVEPISAADWLRLSYGVKGKNLYELLQRNKQYQEISAPGNISHRYVLEDVPMSLVPIASLAESVGVAAPTINLIIDLANIIYGRDFRVEGRTVDSLGIQGLSKKELINLVNNGMVEEVKVHPLLNRRIKKGLDNLVYRDYYRSRKEVE
jgi:opine dehydrogenase